MAAIGMRHIVAAPLATEVHGSAPTYSKGFVVGRAVRANITWDRNDTPLYGEDIIAEDDNGATSYSMELETTELLESVEEKLLGYQKLGEDTEEYEVTGASAPYVGVGFIQVLKRSGKTIYKAFWYYKVQFGRDSEESATKEDKTSWGTPTINGRGAGIFNSSTGIPAYRKHKVFETEEAAAAYIDALAGTAAAS